jgi:hypothetical protein
VSNPIRTPEDIALLSIAMFDSNEHFRDVAGDMVGDDRAVITFECDGRRYEVRVGPISKELEMEVYGGET